MNTERLRRYAYLTVAAVGAALALYLLLKYALGICLPFLVALLIALLADRPSRWISERTHLGVRLVRVIITVLLTLAVLGLAVLLVFCISVKLKDALAGGIMDRIAETVGVITSRLDGVFGELGAGVGDAVLSLVGSFLESFGAFLSGFVGGIPRALLGILVAIISAVYFSLDLDLISGFLRRALPERASGLLSRIRAGFLTTLAKYLRSYLLLMLLTYGIMLAGLLILGRAGAPLVALVIALLDVLPVIGVGTVLLPWSLYCFLTGGTPLGVGLLVLYVVHTVIRQIAEPKIVGESLGVHPLVTLILLYVGYSLFGFFGILLVPLVTVLLEVTLGKENAAKVGEHPARE